MDGPGNRGNDVRGNGIRDMAGYFCTLWAMRHEGSAMSLMEKFLPHYQFIERHQTTVRCKPGELLDIIQAFEPPPDRLTNIALSARQLPAKLLHLVTGSRRPSPAPFTAENFSPLGRDGDREIVGGLVGKFWNVWRPDFGLLAIDGPADFVDANPPRTAKLVLGFLAEQVGEVTLLTTETRVYCPDRYSLIMFTPYWLAIRPFSGLLRRRMLNAIRGTAEQRGSGPDALRTVCSTKRPVTRRP
jgi:hypothetical protein